MSLPSEIRDKIAFFLINSRHRPDLAEGLHRFLAKESPFNSFPLPEVNLEVSLLLNLRLVSRDWHRTATALLREHCWWPIQFDYLGSLERASDACLKGGVVSGIGKLELTNIWDVLTFCRVWKEDSFQGVPDLPDMDNPCRPSFTEHLRNRNSFLPREDGRELQMHYDKSAEHSLLRGLFDNLGPIHGFSLAFPRAEYDENARRPWVQCYDTIALNEVAATVQYGLASAAFEHLVQLRLQVPCTYDIYRFTHTMTGKVRSQLLHLAITIRDDTDEAGNKNIENTASTNDDVVDGVTGASHIPPSNLQLKFPNRAHQNHLWDFVATCPNLESLSISATQYLDLDQLKWIKSSQSRGLRSLVLSRVWTSVPSIIELLRPHLESNGPAQLRFLDLNDVKVYDGGGSWSDLFVYLRSNCPSLAMCVVENLTYFSAHPNYRSLGRIWETYSEIWSWSEKDIFELQELKGELAQQAAENGLHPENMGVF